MESLESLESVESPGSPDSVLSNNENNLITNKTTFVLLLLAKILFCFLGFMVCILFNVRACVRKGKGWHGGEATLKKRRIRRILRIVLDHTQHTPRDRSFGRSD